MSNKNALPIFSTSIVDEMERKNDATKSPLRKRLLDAKQNSENMKKQVNKSSTPLHSSTPFKPHNFVTPKPKNTSGQTSSQRNLLRVKSVPVLTDSSSSSSKQYSVEKTPVTHRNQAGGKNTRRPTKPIKTFLSDNSLNSTSTPECFNKIQVETPQINNSVVEDSESSNFVVGVRVRPMSIRELSDSGVRNVIKMTDTQVEVSGDSGLSHCFTYDHCFWSCDSRYGKYASQETVFNSMVLPLVDSVFQGYNACLLAYGQTGSGKSYSMMGLELGSHGASSEESGVIPRFSEELFNRISNNKDNECHVEISYFEIYNEKIHDLLGESGERSKRAPLRVREHPNFGPYVVDLSVHSVKTFQNLQEWLKVGNSRRVTSSTGMNEKSSRSHSIFSVILTQKCPDNSANTIRSKINLVDLAGSERVAATCASGERLKEGVSINKSLLSLGKVISYLAELSKNKKKTISIGPYRDSVLTWLLRESLGGNSRTAMLATISPASCHVDETIATLRYACQARCIVNRIRRNEDPNERIIRELKAEVEKMVLLKEELNKLKKSKECKSPSSALQKEINELKEKLQVAQQRIMEQEKSWVEREKEAEDRKCAELSYLKKCGIAVELKLDENQPCLINLAADPILSGTLLYMLPIGQVCIGKEGTNEKAKPDIMLTGPLIQQNHCKIENTGKELKLISHNESETYVNGQLVGPEPINLKNGDRLILGGNHYFRVSNPFDEDYQKQTTNVVDFKFAHREILHVQEQKLKDELEVSKAEILRELEEARLKMGSQQFDYELELNRVKDALTCRTEDLDSERRLKQLIEEERNILLSEMEKREKWKLSPYRSSFFQELEYILNEPCTFSPLGSSNSEELSLHELRINVQEATQIFKDFDLDVIFLLQQSVQSTGLEPVIKIKRKSDRSCLLWKPGVFKEWLERLRDLEKEEVIKEWLELSSNEEWESDEEADAPDLQPKRRISINREQFKKRLKAKQHESDLPNNASQLLQEIESLSKQFFECLENNPEYADRNNEGIKLIQQFISNYRSKNGQMSVRFDLT